MFRGLEPGLTQFESATYHLELGKAWIRLGELEQDALSLDTGIESVRQAMKGVDRAYQPIHWAILQGWLGQATVALEKLRRVPSGSLNDGLEAIQESLEVFRNVGASHYVGIAERNLAPAEGAS